MLHPPISLQRGRCGFDRPVWRPPDGFGPTAPTSPSQDEIRASVASQLDDQAKLGVRIVQHNQVPVESPVDGGLWWRILDATAVFADLKRSTSISVNGSRTDAAYAYTYFIRAMTVILERFGAGYVDIQGDGIFGLISGKDSVLAAAACAITMKTQMERAIEPRFRKDASTNQALKVGIGVDHSTLLVRRLGLRGTRQNEVLAGKPLNMAAKLSSVAGNNQVVVSGRVYEAYRSARRTGRGRFSGRVVAEWASRPSGLRYQRVKPPIFGAKWPCRRIWDWISRPHTGARRCGAGSTGRSFAKRWSLARSRRADVGREPQVALRVADTGDRVHQGGGTPRQAPY